MKVKYFIAELSPEPDKRSDRAREIAQSVRVPACMPGGPENASSTP